MKSRKLILPSLSSSHISKIRLLNIPTVSIPNNPKASRNYSKPKYSLSFEIYLNLE